MYFMHQQCKRAVGVFAASLFSVCASVSLWAANPANDITATDRIAATRADPLLSVDLNRTDIVSKLVEQWKNEIAPAQRDSFRAKLRGLRADRLLSVSLVGSFEGVLEVLYGQEKSNTALSVLATTPQNTPLNADESRKALGDLAADLVYTPVTPCRILDTRLSSGGPGPRISGSTTAFNAVATTFVPQGGVSTNCNIPAGAAAIAGTFSMLSASNLGYLTLWAVDTPQPLAATGLFNPSSQQSLNMSSAIVPLCNAVSCTAGKQFNLFVFGSSLDVSFDVSGYFKAPGGTIGDITEIQTAAGSGLTGATTSGIANLSLAPTYKLPQGCISGNIAKYFATPTPVWECATDNGGGGTVTSVGAGIGINGGPVTTSGTLSVAPSFRLPQTCSNGQFTRFNNTLWECVTPSVVTSVATGPGLTGGPITATGTVGLATTQLLPTTACATNQIIKWNGAAWACASETASSTAWTQGGNAFGVPGVIGTTDSQEFKIVAGSGGTTGRLRAYVGSAANGIFMTDTSSLSAKPNTISVTVGSASNSFGFVGATVSGGGYGDINCYDVVSALTNKSCGNSAADEFAVVAGGFGNRVNAAQGTISGGNENTTEETGDTVGGGSRNRAWGPNATVSGGRSNQATFTDSTVSGGSLNLATKRGSTVLGGVNNQATAQYGTALGRGAVARNYGQFAHASNGEAVASPFAPGNAQYSRMVLSSTGSGVNTNMGARPFTVGSPASDEQLRFLPNQSAFVDATVLAKEPGTSNAMAFTIKCIVMVDSAGVMTLSPNPCVPAVQQQTSALTWTMNVVTSALGGANGTILTIRQNSPVGIKWVATVNVTEMLE